MPTPIPFKLTGPYIELVQLLKASGVCSTGGQAKVAVTEGQVKVDGEVETRKGRKVRIGQKVEIDGQMIVIESPE